MFVLDRIVLIVMLGSLKSQGAPFRPTDWELVPPVDRVEVRLSPQTVAMKPSSQENPADDILLRCANTNPHPTSTTIDPYSDSTTAVPRAAAPTHYTYASPASNQPAPYAAPTASASYGPPPSNPSIEDDNGFFLCYFDPHPPLTGDSL